MSSAAALRAILALFFLWGFITCLNDTLVAQLRSVFSLSYARAGLIPVTFFSTCFFFAPLSGIVIERVGYRRAIALALTTMGLGAWLFVPAARSFSFDCFLAAIAVIGAGITLLQAAAGPYVAFLGAPAAATGRFSLALGVNSLGTMLAPLFGSALILRSRSGEVVHRLDDIARVRAAYIFLGSMLLLMSIAVALSRIPPMRIAPHAPGNAGALTHVFRHKPLVWGAATIFLYSGAEIGIGSFLINYLSAPAILGVSHERAALLASLYWGGAVVGRLLGWRLLERFKVEAVLALAACGAASLVLVSTLSHGVMAACSLLTVGLCNALIVPIVVLLGISGLGPLTARASSVMVAANIGAGLLPLALGLLADRVGIHHAIGVTALCYLGVLSYALRGSKGHLLIQRSQRLRAA